MAEADANTGVVPSSLSAEPKKGKYGQALTAISALFSHSSKEKKKGNVNDHRRMSDSDWGSPEMILRMEQLVAKTPLGHPNLPGYHQSLGQWFSKRYVKSDDLDALKTSVQHFQAAVDLIPEEDPNRAIPLQNLAVAFSYRYRRLRDLKDLEAALQTHQGAVDLTPHGHPDRPIRLRYLGISFTERYEKLGDLKDLEAALHIHQEAVDLTPDGHPSRASQLQTLAWTLSNRYKRLGNMKDLEAALKTDREAVHLTPEGDPHRPGRLQSLAISFTDRFRRLGDLKDLEAGLQTLQEVVDLTPEGDPNRPVRLQNLSAAFRHRYRRLGDLKDLEAAVQIGQEAVDLTPHGDPDRAYKIGNLAASLTDRAWRLGDLKDLQSALQICQEVVDLTPQGHPDRANRLQNLAAAFSDQYRRLSDLKDLEAALRLDQEAVDLTPKEDPHRADRLQHLALTLRLRSQRLGDVKDLDAALQIHQQSVDLTPHGHPRQAGRLRNLAMSFTDRYQMMGDLKDLEQALQIGQKALDLTPEGHPDQASQLHTLAISLGDRYEKLGDLKDLEAALQAHQAAVDLTPEGHPKQPVHLQSLATTLRDRYQRLGDLKDLEAAIQRGQEVINLTPHGHPDQAYRLQSLALPFIDRYRRLRDIADLDIAVEIGQKALDLTSQEHPDRAGQLHSLAISLVDRYQRLRDVKDLVAAQQTHQEAVNLTPEGHPELSSRLQSLAVSCMEQYRRLKDPRDLSAVHTHYINSFKSSSLKPHTSWVQALRWASFAEEFQLSDCIPAYIAAFSQLPEILWIGHSISVRHDTIYRLNIQQATSCAIRTCINLLDLVAAVQIIEQGLATIFQQMLQLKPDLHGLKPDQAKNFQNLSSQLYSGTSSNPMKLVVDRNRVLEDICKQPGLEYFLLPKPYKALCQASKQGPIIILNSHADHCDGIIIPKPTLGPVHVPLPTVTIELLKSQQDILKELLSHCSVRNRGEASSSRLFGQCERFSSKPTQECFKDMLDWLWTHIVAPVYKHGIYNGRLWWLPSGEFTGLPLHASPPTDKFIHSYTATLGSLLEAHVKKTLCSTRKFTIVGVTHTGPGGSNSLKGVKQEVTKIISIIKEPYVDCLEGEKATVNAVKSQLQDCSWAHLACHGTQNLSDPTKSHLCLYGGNLELETILRIPLPNAQFVFLAACQTATGDAELVNESFHLGGAFIVAGFRGAIGTMWSMNDQDGPVVAEIVYSHLFRDGVQPQATDAAEALQLAVTELKRRKVPYERWVPFIHMGV